MRTQRAISNIAYLTPAYFELVTNGLRDADRIGPCLWVAHKGEDGDKDHLHILLLDGWGVYNTEGLSTLWGIEPHPDGTTGSLTARWTPTKRIDDWLLYATHNPVYLARKCQFNKQPYTWDDVKITAKDKDLLPSLITSARDFLDEGTGKVYAICEYWVKSRRSWSSLLTSGLLPVACLGSAYQIYEAFWRQLNGTPPPGENDGPGAP